MKKKSHINTGIRKLLEIPQLYNLKGIIFGGENYREQHAKSLNIKSGYKVLDIGCGTSNILKYLPVNIEYYGLDMEEEYIDFCRKEYGDRATFYCEKVGEVEREEWIGNFDVINIHGLLHHLSDSDAESILSTSKKYLKDTGEVVTVDSVFHEGQGAIDKWLVSKDRGQNIKTPAEYVELVSKIFSSVESKVLDDHLRIPYSIFVMRLQK